METHSHFYWPCRELSGRLEEGDWKSASFFGWNQMAPLFRRETRDSNQHSQKWPYPWNRRPSCQSSPSSLWVSALGRRKEEKGKHELSPSIYGLLRCERGATYPWPPQSCCQKAASMASTLWAGEVGLPKPLMLDTHLQAFDVLILLPSSLSTEMFTLFPCMLERCNFLFKFLRKVKRFSWVSGGTLFFWTVSVPLRLWGNLKLG